MLQQTSMPIALKNVGGVCTHGAINHFHGYLTITSTNHVSVEQEVYAQRDVGRMLPVVRESPQGCLASCAS